MWYCVPLCGLGERFVRAGFRTPKPFLRHGGRALIEHVVGSVRMEPGDELVLIAPASYRHRGLEQLTRADNVVYLNTPTAGALDTVYRGLLRWFRVQRAAAGEDPLVFAPIVVLDADTYYVGVDVAAAVRDALAAGPADGAAVALFRETCGRACYSFADVARDGAVRRVVEKVRISDWALSGIYAFGSPLAFFERADALLTHAAVAQAPGEVYMSAVADAFAKSGLLTYLELRPENIRCVGTPEQWLATPVVARPMRICFDLDNTLVTAPRVAGDYATVGPIPANVAYLRQLKAAGNTIIIHTARRMRTHAGNVGKVTADVAAVTLRTLAVLDIPFDEIYFGKPHADVYIDDLAVHAHDGVLCKEVGVLADEVLPARPFNQVTIGEDVVTKASAERAHKIRAEIAWYAAVPAPIRRWFPAILASEDAAYTMTRVRAPTFSQLYVNELLTPHMLRTMLNQLVTLHAGLPVAADGSLLYGNYMAKWRARKRFHRVTDDQAEDVEAFLTAYEADGRAVPAHVHGDPVFTNIFWDETAQHAIFIDPCGVQNDVPMIAGDALYDYAKVLQSLGGYDEVLAERTVTFGYKAPLLRVFWDFVDKVVAGRRDDIQRIRDFLVLSMLPMHEPATADRLFGLYEGV